MNPTSPIGIAELAGRLRLPIRWIKVEAAAGRLPHMRVGRRWLFNEQAVRQHLAERAAREGVARAK
jgi:excisionase family DNA binding protein